MLQGFVFSGIPSSQSHFLISGAAMRARLLSQKLSDEQMDDVAPQLRTPNSESLEIEKGRFPPLYIFWDCDRANWSHPFAIGSTAKKIMMTPGPGQKQKCFEGDDGN
jgi:hypothetical protein